MTYALATVIVPFDAARAKAVDRKLDLLGNPALPPIAAKLDVPALVHFMSMVVLPVNKGERIAHLVIELCADGHADAALDHLAKRVPEALMDVLEEAGREEARGRLAEFLKQHRGDFKTGWPAPAGASFVGTPGMSVERIRDEAYLAEEIRGLLDGHRSAGAALETLDWVRQRIFEDPKLKWAFLSEPVPLLGEARPLWDSWRPLLAAAVRDFLWPLFAIPVAVLLVSWLVLGYGIDAALWHVLLAVLVELLVTGMLVAIGYRTIRAQEKADTPSDKEPSRERMDEILAREDHPGCVQNHLAGVSILKPGWVRRVTLRIALWLIGEVEVRRSKPGHLNKIGTIHFARWFCLPGTNKLVFLSNYGGSWQSYLEDFIARLREGLTSVWSNTRDFPKTESLFRGGAGDSTRFKRWARRQQEPTRFWYAAYPQLNTERIRTNAAIRRGLVAISDEAEAARWLALFGYPLPETLDTGEIPSLAFGGLASLPFAHCLVLALEQPDLARDWLRAIEKDLSYGERPAGLLQAEDNYLAKAPPKPVKKALQVAFTASGLKALLDGDEQALSTFPIPFRDGIAKRSRALGDVGLDAPSTWAWGGTNPKGENRADVLLLLFAESKAELATEVDVRHKQLSAFGRVHSSIALAPIPAKMRDADGTFRRPLIETFGFRDGISQPIMRGTRRWSRTPDPDHSVEAGELVLGYRDNLGMRAPLPRYKSSDFGRNGTYLVVRQLEQDKAEFDKYIDEAAKLLEPRQPKRTYAERVEWIKAKMVGRWPDGTSLVKHPERPGGRDTPPSAPDNAFMFGREDPDGLRCPVGAHIRRANPRESFEPGSAEQLAISNRHRILRVGRSYEPTQTGGKPGLLFMCVNTDIERQFEFLQQTWLMGPNFAGLKDEIDPVVGFRTTGSGMTIPTAEGPAVLPRPLNRFVTVRGGGYFFLPGRSAIRTMCDIKRPQANY